MSAAELGDSGWRGTMDGAQMDNPPFVDQK
jgi:hypothetical protein